MTGVLHIAHSLPSSWLPQTMTWLYTQVHALPAHVSSHVICDAVENIDQFPHAHIHASWHASRVRRSWHQGMMRARLRRYRGQLVDVVHDQGVSIIHSHFGSEGWRNIEAARRTGAQHVISFYGYDVNCLPLKSSVWKKRYRDLFHSASAILCEGPHMAACIRGLGCPSKKVIVHHLGVDLASIPYQPRTWDGRSPLRILMAASFREKKGLPYGMRAIGRIAKETPVQVTLVGDATEAPGSREEKQHILGAIESCELQDRVHMPGFLTHRKLFEAASDHHVFLSPSLTAADGDTEGGAPVALIDMAASGMPIVSTTHCDIPEVILHKSTGRLAPERDVDGLVDQLRYLIEERGNWQSMLDQSRKRVEEEFCAHKQGQRLADLYARLAA